MKANANNDQLIIFKHTPYMESHKFYNLMNYPVPRNSTLYSYINEPSI